MIKGRNYCRIGVELILVGLLFARKSFCREAGVSFHSEGSYIDYRFAKTKLSVGAVFYLRFASSLCEGDILLVTSRDNPDNFYRFSLENTGALTFYYRLTDAFEVQMQLPNHTSFCDGKEHDLTVRRLGQYVLYKVKGKSEQKHYEVGIRTLNFGKPDHIILGGREGKKFSGIIYNATVDILWEDKRISSVPLVQKYFGNDIDVLSAGVINIAEEDTGYLQPVCTNNTHISLKDSSGIIMWNPLTSREAWNMTFCSWTISAPADNRVRLTLLHFKINNSRTCFDSYLEVFDGSDSNAPLLVRYCNPDRLKIRSNDQSMRYSSGQHMKLQLSIGSDTDVEVMVFYKAVGLDKGPCPTNARLEGNSGKITSPDFPYHYGNQRSCSWIITAPKGYHVLLTFYPEDFHVFGCSNTCECGYLEARGGRAKESNLLGKYCGAWAPSPIYSWHRHMWLGFVSHSQSGHKGFRATYSAVESLKDECPRKEIIAQTTKHGNISSPRFPLYYPGNMECFWKIKVDEKHIIKLEFNTPIHLDPNCTDYVEIHDGGKSSKLCESSSHPPPLYSRTNELLIVFHSDGYRTSDSYGISGFSITYLAAAAKSGTGFSATISTKHMTIKLMVALFVCYLAHNIST